MLPCVNVRRWLCLRFLNQRWIMSVKLEDDDVSNYPATSAHEPCQDDFLKSDHVVVAADVMKFALPPSTASTSTVPTSVMKH